MLRIFTCIIAFIFSIEGIAAQCAPQLINCFDYTMVFCDTSVNSNQYWNDMPWWDNANQSHDLAEGKVDINFSVKDTCQNGNLTIRCLLFLDLDGDEVVETLVDFDNPNASGMVNFGNITGVGTPRLFDQRPLPANHQWHFVLENIQKGDTLTARIRWNTILAPGDFYLPELAYGLHKVRWELSDNTGLLNTCEYPVKVKDCKAPTIECKNLGAYNMLPNHQRQLWTTNFLVSTNDNVTQTPFIKLGIRKTGTGTGFPVDDFGNPITSIIFDCTTELGLQLIELWAIDIPGNADFCQSTVLIQDPNGHCTNWGGVIKVCTTVACYDNFLEHEGAYVLSYVDSGQIITQVVDYHNCIPNGQDLPINTDITITPIEDGLYNSYIGTYDMVIMSKHISQVDTFNTPLQWVSADANQDGLITEADVKACRDHVLGIEPLEHTWRFVEKSYVFPWPGNPLAVPFPENVTVHPSNSTPVEVEFYAIPICDVTCGNVVSFFELESEDQHLIGVPQPNPTYSSAMLPLQLVSDETIFFELTDATGKLLLKKTVAVPPGDAMLDIPAFAMPVPGLYFWRIHAGEVEKSGKISKI